MRKDAPISIHGSTLLFLTIEVPNTTLADLVNAVDSDETAHYDLSLLTLQCLPSKIFNIIQLELDFFT